MSSITNGATLETSAALPATFDASGYTALTYTVVGEILNVGDLGQTFTLITQQPLGDSYPTKKKEIGRAHV